jgi:hypothetical protein
MSFTHQADEHAVDKIALPDNPGGKMLANAIQQGRIHAAIVGGLAGI